MSREGFGNEERRDISLRSGEIATLKRTLLVGAESAGVTVYGTPEGAVQEVTVLSNAFFAEYGWTAGPAVNVVTKSGTNNLHGEALYLIRPENGQAKTFSTDGFCPPSVDSCVTPGTLSAINPVDIPDELNQYSGSVSARARSIIRPAARAASPAPQ